MKKKRKLRKDRVFIAFLLLILIIFSIYKIGSYVKSLSKKEKISPIQEHQYLSTIIIDPGHGGLDAGAKNGKLYEKDITLKVAFALGKELSKENIKVIYTRVEDKSLSNDKGKDLTLRTNMSKENKANYYISLHVNDYMDATAKVTGIEAYVRNDNVSKDLGNRILKDLSSLKYAKNRGLIDGSHLHVLRENTVPSILIELGYINGLDFDYLKDDKKLEILGKTIGKTLINKIKGND